MISNVFQCCYTNAESQEGGSLSTGWQTVAVSSEIPPSALSSCSNWQKVNSTIQGAMTDENGNVLDLLEVFGDNEFAYIMRSKYGLQDHWGRANMFSHAFIFPWSEQTLADPNLFLGVDDSCFASSQEEAEGAVEKLSYSSGYSLVDSLELLGISGSSYRKMIYCVYAQMTEKALFDPVYVQCDGTSSQMRALLYCIYVGLPYGLRKRLCSSSAVGNNIASTNIVFTENASQKPCYINPRTGENNVLNERLEAKLLRYGYLDYALAMPSEEAMNNYYSLLDKLVAELGNEEMVDPLITKLAHQMIAGGDASAFQDDELLMRLSDALRSTVNSNDEVERYIATLLHEAFSRRLRLTDECEESLAKKLTAAKTQELKEAGLEYNVYRFSDLPVDEAAHKLSLMSGGVLESHLSQLSNLEGGQEILDAYFSSCCMPTSQEATWEQMAEALDEACAAMPILRTSEWMRSRTGERFDAEAAEKYRLELCVLGNPADALSNYALFMEKLLSPEELERCKADAKEGFWQEYLRFEAFDYLKKGQYRAMSDDSRRAQMFLALFSLDEMMQGGTADTFLVGIHDYFDSYEDAMTEEERPAAMSLIERRAAEWDSKGVQNLTPWIRVAILAPNRFQLDAALNLRIELEKQQYNEAANCFGDIGGLGLGGAVEEFRRAVGEASLAMCQPNDSAETPIPLDLWLEIGCARGASAFDIFDDVKPTVLEQPAEDVVRESSALSKFQFAATQYVDRQGSEFRVVKKWLSEFKRSNKKPRKNPFGKKQHEQGAHASDNSDSGRGFIGFFNRK